MSSSSVGQNKLVSNISSVHWLVLQKKNDAAGIKDKIYFGVIEVNCIKLLQMFEIADRPVP